MSRPDEPLVLGIETSCDETGVGIVRGTTLLADAVASSMDEHAAFGGVVPEVASRAHLEAMVPTIEQACLDAGVQLRDIDAVAVTAGPGLAGALLVGAASAKALAVGLGKPLYGVNHLSAHVAVDVVEHGPLPEPMMSLLVSGGHSSLLMVPDITHDVRPMGQTIDDAAGEAFDKTDKLMGMDYPGGPLLSRLAEKGTTGRFTFPRPMTDRPGLDMSFSGLKTFAANTIAANGDDEQTRADIARAFEDAVVDTLAIKCRRALKETGLNRLVVAGGVSANRHLRAQLAELMESLKGEVFYPRTEYCTDNGAMIAYAGMQRLKAGVFEPLAVKAVPRWPLDTLDPV